MATSIIVGVMQHNVALKLLGDRSSRSVLAIVRIACSLAQPSGCTRTQ